MSIATPALNGNAPSLLGDHDADDDHPTPDDEQPIAGIYARFKALLPEAQEDLRQLDARREEIQQRHQARIEVILAERRAELVQLDTERKQIIALLKAMGVEVELPKKTSRRSAPKYGAASFSDEKFVLVLNALSRQGDNLFSALGIHDAIAADWNQTLTYGMFDHLRKTETIRFVRKEAGIHGRQMFRVFDQDEVKTLITRIRGERSRETQVVKAPTRVVLDATLQAMRQHEAPFTAREITTAMGLASPKQTYQVFKFMREQKAIVASKDGKTGSYCLSDDVATVERALDGAR